MHQQDSIRPLLTYSRFLRAASAMVTQRDKEPSRTQRLLYPHQRTVDTSMYGINFVSTHGCLLHVLLLFFHLDYESFCRNDLQVIDPLSLFLSLSLSVSVQLITTKCIQGAFTEVQRRLRNSHFIVSHTFAYSCPYFDIQFAVICK